MKQFTTIGIIAILLLTLFACGYRFSGGGALPGGVQRIAVGVFDNPSGETGLESILSNEIIYEITRNGKEFTRKSEAADAILSGSVVEVCTWSVPRKSVHNVQERRVSVTVSLELTDPKGRMLWQISALSENEEYEVADAEGVTEQNKRAAIRKLSKRMAEKAYCQMTENF
jgi:hypothetical protein